MSSRPQLDCRDDGFRKGIRRSWFSRVLAIVPRQDIAATMRHFNAGPGGGPLGLIDCDLCGVLRRSCRTTGGVFSGCLHIGNPAQERREVRDVGDVPKFLGGVPAGSQRLDRILLCEGRD